MAVPSVPRQRTSEERLTSLPLPDESELDRSFTQWEREQKAVVVPVDVEIVQRYYHQALPSEWEECE